MHPLCSFMKKTTRKFNTATWVFLIDMQIEYSGMTNIIRGVGGGGVTENVSILEDIWDMTNKTFMPFNTQSCKMGNIIILLCSPL